MKLKCYGCDQEKDLSEMRYECMCTEKRGVCRMCVDTNREVKIPDSHNLTQLHDMTDEYKVFIEDIEKNCGKLWNTMSCNETSTEIDYLQGANGERDENLRDLIKQGYYSDSDFLRKKKIFPPLPQKICTCCS
jgi:hypothetical protein